VKSKKNKWLISLVLVVVLVLAFALPACGPAAKQGWYTPEGEKVSFKIASPPGHHDKALLIVQDLKDFGLDVSAPPMDSSTFYDIIYTPDAEGSLQAFVWADDPAPDPWSDWIWCYFADPEDWGYMWNPCWYDDEEMNNLFFENYLATNMTRKEEILLRMQEKLAEDVPVVYLMREDIITACRTDRWANWFNEMGGYATWINEYSIREVTNVTAETRLNIAVPSMPNTLNMEQLDFQNTNLGTIYLMIVYEPLYAYPKVDPATLAIDPDAAYGFAPRLVKAYDWSYEGTSQILTLDLEEGVKWHDGENFTADDVVFSFKSMVIYPWAPNMPINWTAVYDEDYPWCDDDICPDDILVEKDGDYKVKLTYVDGYHQPTDYLPNDFLWYSIVPEHVFGPDGETNYPDSWNEDPAAWDGECIGTGPFKVKEDGYVVDQYLLLERNEEYYGELPAATEVLFKLYEDDNAMWMAFESDDPNSLMDLAIAGVKFQKKAQYEADPRITVEVMPDLSISALGFNLHETGGYAPLGELPLRQAIAAAINKVYMCTMLAGGYAEPADSYVYLESPYHHDSLPNNAYNLTLAESILTAAGYKLYEDGVQVN